MNALLDAVRVCLKASGLWSNQSRLLCAVSGGADSMALVHALSRLRAEAGFALMARHVQHGLRGAQSDADEQFVREVCRALDVPLEDVLEGNIAKLRKRYPQGFEAERSIERTE